MHHFYIGWNYRMVSISIPICRLLLFLRCKSLFAHVSPVGEHENVFPVILRRVYMYIDWSRQCYHPWCSATWIIPITEKRFFTMLIGYWKRHFLLPKCKYKRQERKVPVNGAQKFTHTNTSLLSSFLEHNTDTTHFLTYICVSGGRLRPKTSQLLWIWFHV